MTHDASSMNSAAGPSKVPSHCDFHAGLTSSVALESARKLLRSHIPPLTDDRYLHADMQRAIKLVQAGAVVAAAVGVDLPSLAIPA